MCRQWLIPSLALALFLAPAGLSRVSAQIDGRAPLPGTVLNLDSAIKYLQSDNPKDRAFALTTLEYDAPVAILCATNMREMGALEMYKSAIVHSICPTLNRAGDTSRALSVSMRWSSPYPSALPPARINHWP